MPEGRIPAATVSRLPVYLKALVDAAEAQLDTVSSDDLARAGGVNSAKVRKDLSYLGSHGTRGVGYRVGELTAEISGVLGLTGERPVAIIGAGNLGRALASYDGFARRGFTVAAMVDSDPDKIGERVVGHTVESFDDLAGVVAAHGIGIAVLAVPAEAAQLVAEHAVESGISAILNFAPTHLEVPDGVTVRTVDLSTELQILSFYEHLEAGERTATG